MTERADEDGIGAPGLGSGVEDGGSNAGDAMDVIAQVANGADDAGPVLGADHERGGVRVPDEGEVGRGRRKGNVELVARSLGLRCRDQQRAEAAAQGG